MPSALYARFPPQPHRSKREGKDSTIWWLVGIAKLCMRKLGYIRLTPLTTLLLRGIRTLYFCITLPNASRPHLASLLGSLPENQIRPLAHRRDRCLELKLINPMPSCRGLVRTLPNTAQLPIRPAKVIEPYHACDNKADMMYCHRSPGTVSRPNAKRRHHWPGLRSLFDIGGRARDPALREKTVWVCKVYLVMVDSIYAAVRSTSASSRYRGLEERRTCQLHNSPG